MASWCDPPASPMSDDLDDPIGTEIGDGWAPWIAPLFVASWSWMPCVLLAYVATWTLAVTVPALAIGLLLFWRHQRHLPGVTSWWHP